MREIDSILSEIATEAHASPPEPLTWREQRKAKVLGDKLLVVCIRPDGEPGWLYLERLEDIEDYLLEGEPGDEWQMKWVLMSREEIDALPEHPGW